MRLQRHNARRRKKAAERPSSKKMALGKGRLVTAGFQQHQAPALSVPKQVSKCTGRHREGSSKIKSGPMQSLHNACVPQVCNIFDTEQDLMAEA